jgi:hypothetical protein
MKNIISLRLAGLLVAVNFLTPVCTANSSTNPSDRDRLFNTGWKFIRDTISGAEQPGFDDSKWMVVDLPHDYSIMTQAIVRPFAKSGTITLNAESEGLQTGELKLLVK